jgi:hypothetical protein
LSMSVCCETDGVAIVESATTTRRERKRCRLGLATRARQGYVSKAAGPGQK